MVGNLQWSWFIQNCCIFMYVSWPSVVLGMANPAQSGIESGLGLNLPISILGHLDLVDKVNLPTVSDDDFSGISPYVICPQMKEGYLQEKSQQILRAHIPLALKDLSWKDSFHLRCCGDLGYAPEVCPNNFSEYTKIPKSTRQNYVGFPDKTCNSWTVEIIHPVISLRSGSELYKYY